MPCTSKSTLLILLALYVSFSTFAQAPGIPVLRCIGGTGDERFTSNAIMSNGLLVNVGYTVSTDGDCVGNHGGSDILVVATGSDGVTKWKKLIGGTGDEGLSYSSRGTSVDQTLDGNMIIAFNSTSNDGDITGNHGSADVVFNKYDLNGNLLWSKVYGGDRYDALCGIKATADGGIIALCYTNSNNSGNVSANRATDYYADNWIVKLDSNGNIQWEKSYGGSLNEENGGITTSADGGYYFTSTTTSTDGDLTNLVPAGTAAGVDVWIAKTDAAGVIQWSKQVGGSDEEADPNVYSAGSSVYLALSSRSADRDLGSNAGLFDMAMFKYDAAGALVWKNVFGGTAWDAETAVAGNNNGDLLLGGLSYSTKINGLPFTTYTLNCEMVLIKIDTFTGLPKWLRNFGGTQNDFLRDVKINSNGDFFICGETQSNDVDISHNHGGYDAVTFLNIPKNIIKGTVYIDANNNGVIDAADTRPNFIKLGSTQNGVLKSESLSYTGQYSLEVDTGTFVTAVHSYNPGYYTIAPDSFSTTFNQPYQTVTQDILLKPAPNLSDVRVTVIGLGPARPAYHTEYLVLGYNVGTDTIAAGTVSMVKDSRVTYTSFTPQPDYISGDSISWNYTNLAPFDSTRFHFTVATPGLGPLQVGGYLRYIATMSPRADYYPSDNKLTLYHLVVGSLDPNDKSNTNGNKMSLAELQDNDFINYVVRFQNTGTAPAFDVIVKDTLASSFDIGSLEVVTASHPYQYMLENNIVTFKFKDINLPDSTADEPHSHGYIAFRIKPKKNLQAGDTINNSAAIYFDYNEAVITNVSPVVIYDPSIILPLQNIVLSAKVVNNIVRLSWQAYTTEGKSFIVERSANSVTGFEKIAFQPVAGNASLYSYNDAAVQKDNTYYYRIKVIDANGESIYSPIAVASLFGRQSLTIMPNPSHGHFTIVSPEKITATLSLYNNEGKKVFQAGNAVINENGYTISTSHLPAAPYLLQIAGNSVNSTKKIIVR